MGGHREFRAAQRQYNKKSFEPLKSDEKLNGRKATKEEEKLIKLLGGGKGEVFLRCFERKKKERAHLAEKPSWRVAQQQQALRNRRQISKLRQPPGRPRLSLV